MEEAPAVATGDTSVTARPAWMVAVVGAVALIVACYKLGDGRVNSVTFDTGPSLMEQHTFELRVRVADSVGPTLIVQSSALKAGNKAVMEPMLLEELQGLIESGAISTVMAAWCAQSDALEIEVVLK